ncbi:MAG: type I restriction enzyme HsdR N-terminal domain-containing protein [Bacteroidales bacterium]|nr:type I restriction enzyme HsdR N-terminal domain-containing protein [Bacteroidales bacterium]
MSQVWDPLRKKMVALTPEEKVRQWFIGVLRDSLMVPEHMMMSEVSFKYGDKPFRADILVYGRDLSPLMVVECKRDDVEVDRDVLAQALRYNLALGVKFIVITNGLRTFGFRRKETAGQAGHDESEVPYEQIKVFPTWEEMMGND